MCSWQVTRKHQEERVANINVEFCVLQDMFLSFAWSVEAVQILTNVSGAARQEQHFKIFQVSFARLPELGVCHGVTSPVTFGALRTFRAGRLTCILGPSGSGKTTLLNAGRPSCHR